MPAQTEFTTIAGMFVATTDKLASQSRTAVEHLARQSRAAYSYSELRGHVDAFANGLLALGVSAGDRIGLIAESRIEWMIADHASLAIGAADVPIFPNFTAEQAQWIFADAGVSIVVVSNELQLRKMLRFADALLLLRNIIVMREDVNRADARVLSFRDVQRQGERFAALHPERLAQARAAVEPETLATIIYTSGTTGAPKGVMLTHANLVFDLLAAIAALPVIDENDVFLSYLPLCHSFERIANYFMFACGARIAIAESIETLAENLIAVKPTIVTTVPRMLERMHKRVVERAAAQPPFKQRMFHRAFAAGRRYKSLMRVQIVSPWLHVRYALAEQFVFRKLRARIGGRLRFFVSGGAALAPELGEFFDAAGITILEGYGMTECSPVVAVNPVHAYKFGTVGKPLPGVEVKIADDGEILTRGPHVMRGYWNNPAATQETIDAAGWLHTGDVGALDAEGYLSITDRKKDLIVSSGGKNIAPQHIENLLGESPFIDQIVLIGDRKPFITALIVPEFAALGAEAAKLGIASLPPAELILRPEIVAIFGRELARLQAALAGYERVRRFTLLAEPFTVEAGDLTPTLKVRRTIVAKKFAAAIERMYREALG